MPQSHIDAMALESQALAEVALRCASRSVSRAASRMPSRAPSRAPSRGPSRAVSRAVSRRPSVVDLPDLSNLEAYSTESLTGEDAFERILDVTTHQEALMAYYYLDDNNEVRGRGCWGEGRKGKGCGVGLRKDWRKGKGL